jgi:hypothetical protein
MNENGPAVSDDVRDAVQKALEKAGVEFIAENGGGAGVRMRKRRRRFFIRRHPTRFGALRRGAA